MFLGVGQIHAFSIGERDQKFVEALKLASAGNYPEALNIYSELEKDDYGTGNPILYYRIGDLHRRWYKSKGGSADLNKAVGYLEKSRLIYEKNPNGMEYKSTMISLAYSYVLLEKYAEAMSAIELLLKIKPNDYEGITCKAYINNSWGFKFYSQGKYDTAIDYFDHAYQLRKYPVFANNLINAHLFACDETVDAAKKINHILKSKKIYLEQVKTAEWNDPVKGYSATGVTIKRYIRKYKLENTNLREEPLMPTPTPTPQLNWWQKFFSKG